MVELADLTGIFPGRGTEAASVNILVRFLSVGGEIIQKAVKKLGKAGDDLAFKTKRWKKVTDEYGNETWELVSVYKTLRMELLSVMFFGMALNRTFGGLFKTMKKITVEGAIQAAQFSIMAATFNSPIWQLYQKTMWGIAKAIMDLPDPIKEVLGQGQILVGWAGTAWEKFGMLGLGISGLKIAFEDLLPKLKDVGEYLKDKLAKTWDVIVSFAKKGWDIVTDAYKYLKEKFVDFIYKPIIEPIVRGLKAAYNSFMLWYNNLPRSLQILVGIGLAITAAEFGYKLGQFIGEATQEMGRKFLEELNKIPILRDIIGILVMGGLGITGIYEAITRKRGWEALRPAVEFREAWWGPLGIPGGGVLEGARQMGGPILRSGLYRLHKGEYVVPRGRAQNITNFGGLSPTININISGETGLNEEELARRISDRMYLEMRRLVM